MVQGSWNGYILIVIDNDDVTRFTAIIVDNFNDDFSLPEIVIDNEDNELTEETADEAIEETIVETDTEVPAETPAQAPSAIPEITTIVILTAVAAPEVTPATAPAAAASSEAASIAAPAAVSAPAAQVLGVTRDRRTIANEIVEGLYNNVLNRASDESGKTFWVNTILADDSNLDFDLYPI